METNMHDLIVFFSGLITGGVLMTIAMLALTKVAVERIIQEMIRRGSFNFEGVAYSVRQKTGGLNDG